MRSRLTSAFSPSQMSSGKVFAYSLRRKESPLNFPMLTKNQYGLRCAVQGHRTHNPQVVGSSPTTATNSLSSSFQSNLNRSGNVLRHEADTCPESVPAGAAMEDYTMTTKCEGCIAATNLYGHPAFCAACCNRLEALEPKPTDAELDQRCREIGYDRAQRRAESGYAQ